MTFGDRVRQLRLQKNLGITETERLAGLAKGNLARVERSEQWLSEKKIYGIATALGVSAADLFENEGAEATHLGADEQALMACYRATTPKGKQQMLTVARMLASSNLSEDEQAIMQAYRATTPEGQSYVREVVQAFSIRHRPMKKAS